MAKTNRTREGHTDHSDNYFPKELKLGNGRTATLRLMTAEDKDAILAFASGLPADDLLFLRTDITEDATVSEWVRNIERGSTITALAELDSEIAGYASVHHEQARWTRRVGELRLLLGPKFRGIGLGRRLAEEIFHLGERRGVKKMAAMMTPDQTGARAAFERLGFQVEALLQDWVVDRNGRPRDLLVMSVDLEAVSDRLSA